MHLRVYLKLVLILLHDVHLHVHVSSICTKDCLLRQCVTIIVTLQCSRPCIYCTYVHARTCMTMRMYMYVHVSCFAWGHDLQIQRLIMYVHVFCTTGFHIYTHN